LQVRRRALDYEHFGRIERRPLVCHVDPKESLNGSTGHRVDVTFRRTPCARDVNVAV
jgi:hypothetical protein